MQEIRHLISSRKPGVDEAANIDADLVSFADDGTGDRLCFRMEAGQAQDGVYLWTHEDGQIEKVAPDLKTLILTTLGSA